VTRNLHLVTDSKVRLWKCGDFPIPDWVTRHISDGIESNGTFTLRTKAGPARVHAGNAVIEHCGAIWVQPSEDAADFIASLELTADAIPSIGPGKRHRYGTGGRSKRKSQDSDFDRAPAYPAPVGPLPTIEWIHLQRLSIDHTYQRSPENVASRRLIAGIAARFDWRLCAPLVVSRRADDTLTIIDGQHRWLAARRRQDIPQLPCCVFRYASMEEEARMFIVANRARKPINRLDDYHAALAAKDEDALEIQQLVTSAGLSIARTTSSAACPPGEIAFTSAIASAIRQFGPPIVSAALTNLAVAFPNQRLTHGATILGALVRILAQRGADFDPDRLMSALQTQTSDEWGSFAARSHGGPGRIAAVRAAIMDVYDQLSLATAS
jgi:hypothetical protein